MPRGGVRENAGRRPGSRNKKTIEREDAIAAGGIMPLDYLLGIVRNESLDQSERVDAAKAAAPYIHPRLSSIALDGESHVTVDVNGESAKNIATAVRKGITK